MRIMLRCGAFIIRSRGVSDLTVSTSRRILFSGSASCTGKTLFSGMTKTRRTHTEIDGKNIQISTGLPPGVARSEGTVIWVYLPCYNHVFSLSHP